MDIRSGTGSSKSVGPRMMGGVSSGAQMGVENGRVRAKRFLQLTTLRSRPRSGEGIGIDRSSGPWHVSSFRKGRPYVFFPLYRTTLQPGFCLSQRSQLAARRNGFFRSSLPAAAALPTGRSARHLPTPSVLLLGSSYS